MLIQHRRLQMSLKEVLLDELRDMYSAENQLVKALPKLASGANDSRLAQLFANHLEETKGHVVRLQNVFDILKEKPTGQHCGGMEGVVEEGSEALEKGTKDASFDAGLVGAALRAEHYEMAGYQACISMARTLGQMDVVELLTESLKEEVAAADKVTAVGDAILEKAASEPDQDTEPMTGKEKYSDKKSKEDETEAASAVKKHG
jgi:ferritin-like metal-binding protein YciE